MPRYAYKVLKPDLTNVGLLKAPVMQYRFAEWMRPLEPLSDHPRKGGGLWTAPTLSVAKQYAKYLRRKHGLAVRIFRCRIGDVLYETSCRIKTDALYFTEADEVTT